MFQADAEIMKISVNTAIEVVVGLLKSSGNTPRIASPVATSSVPGEAFGHATCVLWPHCARTAALPNRPFGMNESTTISDA